MNNSHNQKETAKTYDRVTATANWFSTSNEKNKIDGWKNQLNCIPFASNEQEHR